MFNSINFSKADFKKVTVVDTAEFAKQSNLNSLKSDIDELDIDVLGKLSNVVHNDVFKKNEYKKY